MLNCINKGTAGIKRLRGRGLSMAYPLRVSLAVFLLAFLFVSTAFADPATPSALVSRFQAGLLDTMRSAKVLGLKGRFKKLAPLIGQTFHLPLMAATASAPFWRGASEEQRRALVAAFERMSVSSVATLFDDYGKEKFEIVRERKTKGPTVLVDTRIVRPEKDPIKITYVTASLRERWWIIDIIVGGGISEIKVRRDEYLSPLKQGGLPALTRKLSEKAERLLSGQEKASR
ncbi:MAG: ABC transporter substrate-binding protein [Alphaproteobacteria bacterium]